MISKSERKYENRWLSNLVKEWMDEEDNDQYTTLVMELARFLSIRTKMLAHHTEQPILEPKLIAQILGDTYGLYLNEAKISEQQCPNCLLEIGVEAFYVGLTNTIDVTEEQIKNHGTENDTLYSNI